MNIVIINHLSGEDLNDEQKLLRDECLEDLLNHVNDISSYVRSKVLHIWNDLKTREAVPLAWILRIVKKAIERLEDKTATVRKNAITLLRSFLESNPFSAKVSDFGHSALHYIWSFSQLLSILHTFFSFL